MTLAGLMQILGDLPDEDSEIWMRDRYLDAPAPHTDVPVTSVDFGPKGEIILCALHPPVAAAARTARGVADVRLKMSGRDGQAGVGLGVEIDGVPISGVAEVAEARVVELVGESVKLVLTILVNRIETVRTGEGA